MATKSAPKANAMALLDVSPAALAGELAEVRARVERGAKLLSELKEDDIEIASSQPSPSSPSQPYKFDPNTGKPMDPNTAEK